MKLEKFEEILQGFIKIEKELGLDQIDEEESIPDFLSGILGSEQVTKITISNENYSSLNRKNVIQWRNVLGIDNTIFQLYFGFINTLKK